MKLSYLTGVLALTIIASASSFVSAQSNERTGNRDLRFSPPSKGGVIVGTPGDTVISAFEKSPFEETTGAGSADSATAIEYGLIAAMVPEMPNPSDDEQAGLALNLGDGLIAVVIITAHSSELGFIKLGDIKGELGFIKLGDIKGELKGSSSNEELP